APDARVEAERVAERIEQEVAEGGHAHVGRLAAGAAVASGKGYTAVLAFGATGHARKRTAAATAGRRRETRRPSDRQRDCSRGTFSPPRGELACALGLGSRRLASHSSPRRRSRRSPRRACGAPFGRSTARRSPWRRSRAATCA